MLESVPEEQQVVGPEGTGLSDRNKEILAARIDVGEHSRLGIPGVEACFVWRLDKEELRTVACGRHWSEEVSLS